MVFKVEFENNYKIRLNLLFHLLNGQPYHQVVVPITNCLTIGNPESPSDNLDMLVLLLVVAF